MFDDFYDLIDLMEGDDDKSRFGSSGPKEDFFIRGISPNAGMAVFAQLSDDSGILVDDDDLEPA